MVKETLHRTVTEAPADLFRKIEQTDAYHINAMNVEISEQIYLTMKQQGVSKVELARRVGKSRVYVTRALQGDTNFTIPSLVKIARALNRKVDVRLLPKNNGSRSL